MYCKCSFLRVTLVCPPIGPPGTVVARETESGVGMIITNSLYQALTCISINKDGVCLHMLSHGFYISKGPSFIACIVVRSKWSSLWRWSRKKWNMSTQSLYHAHLLLESDNSCQLNVPLSLHEENTHNMPSLQSWLLQACGITSSLLPLWCHLAWMRGYLESTQEYQNC